MKRSKLEGVIQGLNKYQNSAGKATCFDIDQSLRLAIGTSKNVILIFEANEEISLMLGKLNATNPPSIRFICFQQNWILSCDENGVANLWDISTQENFLRFQLTLDLERLILYAGVGFVSLARGKVFMHRVVKSFLQDDCIQSTRLGDDFIAIAGCDAYLCAVNSKKLTLFENGYVFSACSLQNEVCPISLDLKRNDKILTAFVANGRTIELYTVNVSDTKSTLHLERTFQHGWEVWSQFEILAENICCVIENKTLIVYDLSVDASVETLLLCENTRSKSYVGSYFVLDDESFVKLSLFRFSDLLETHKKNPSLLLKIAQKKEIGMIEFDPQLVLNFFSDYCRERINGGFFDSTDCGILLSYFLVNPLIVDSVNQWMIECPRLISILIEGLKLTSTTHLDGLNLQTMVDDCVTRSAWIDIFYLFAFFKNETVEPIEQLLPYSNDNFELTELLISKFTFHCLRFMTKENLARWHKFPLFWNVLCKMICNELERYVLDLCEIVFTVPHEPDQLANLEQVTLHREMFDFFVLWLKFTRNPPSEAASWCKFLVHVTIWHFTEKKDKLKELHIRDVLRHHQGNIDWIVTRCEISGFHSCLSLLYELKKDTLNCLRSYINAQDEYVFVYIHEMKNVREEKAILDRFLVDLLELNADITVSKVIIPYFQDWVSQEKILHILREKRDKSLSLYRYLNALNNSKALKDDLLRFEYLGLLVQYHPENVDCFIGDNELWRPIHQQSIDPIISHLPLVRSFVMEMREEHRKSYDLLLESFKGNLTLNRVNQFSEILDRCVTIMNEHGDETWYNDLYITMVDLLVACRHEADGKTFEAEENRLIMQYSDEIKHCKDDMMLMDRKDKKYETKKKHISELSERIKTLRDKSRVPKVPKEFNAIIQDCLKTKIFEFQEKEYIPSIKLLDRIITKYDESLNYCEDVVNELVKLHKEHTRWLEIKRDFLRKDLIRFQKEVFEVNQRKGTSF